MFSTIPAVNGLWQYDQTLFKQINLGWHSAWLDPIFWVISSSGLGWVQLIMILICIPWPLVFRRGTTPWANYRAFIRDRTVLAASLLPAWIITGVIDQAVKYGVPRDRPSNWNWSLPEETVYSRSFASGHTATSFGIAFTIFFLTSGTKRAWWGWVALVWAALVGVSRVYRGVHWPSDVLSGFFIGLGCAALTMLVLPLRGSAES